MSEREPIRIEKDEHVAWVILNRPEKRNAMSLDFFDGLVKHFTAFDEDPEVRVIVVKAEGESFTAGIDLMDLSAAHPRGRGCLPRKPKSADPQDFRKE